VDWQDTLLAVLVGLGAAAFIFFVLRVPTNVVDDDDDDDEDDAGDEPHVEYDPAAPDPWEAEVGPETPLRDVDTLIDVLRTGEPGPCRKAIEDLVAHGQDALPALRAAAAEDDPDLRIDAEQAIARIEA